MLDSQLFNENLEALRFFGNHAQIPEIFMFDLFEGITRDVLTSPVETDDAALRIQHHHQSADRVQYRRNHIAFFLQSFFGPLELSDIEGNAVDEPGPSVLATNHLGFAVKPDYSAISRNYTIGGAQWSAREKHLRCLDAPTLFVLGMDLLIPANGIFQPFFLRKTQAGFNLWTHIGFSDASVQVGHENDCRNLLDQSAVDSVNVRQLLF